MSIKAFPVNDIIERDDKGHYIGKEVSQTGMNLRDYFAGKAMQSMVVDTQVKDFDWAARMSYKMADEMMKARG